MNSHRSQLQREMFLCWIKSKRESVRLDAQNLIGIDDIPQFNLGRFLLLGKNTKTNLHRVWLWLPWVISTEAIVDFFPNWITVNWIGGNTRIQDHFYNLHMNYSPLQSARQQTVIHISSEHLHWSSVFCASHHLELTLQCKWFIADK